MVVNASVFEGDEFTAQISPSCPKIGYFANEALLVNAMAATQCQGPPGRPGRPCSSCPDRRGSSRRARRGGPADEGHVAPSHGGGGGGIERFGTPDGVRDDDRTVRVTVSVCQTVEKHIRNPL